MAGNREIAIALGALATLLALVALVTPWWTMNVDGGGTLANENAGPFNRNEDMISTVSAVTTGILTLLGLLAMAVATALLVYSMATNKQDKVIQKAPLVLLAGGVLLALSLVLAIFIYPSEMEDFTFWESHSGGGFTVSTYATWGWYLGIGSVVLAITAAVLALKHTAQEPGTTATAPKQPSG